MSLELSLSLIPAQTLLSQSTPPVASGYTATLQEFSRDRTIFDSGAARGVNAADIPLGGTTNAPDGTAIEARAVSLDDGGASTTPWVSLGSAFGGSFVGVLSAPRSTSWFRAEVRVVGSSGPARAMSSRFGCGHVWAIWEQSNHAKLYNSMPSNASELYDPVSHEGDVQIAPRIDTQIGAVYPITEATKGSTPVTPAMVSFANAFSAMAPGEKLMVVMHTKTNTSIMAALSTEAESSDNRDWAVEETLNAVATQDGSKVGVVFIPGWTASTIGFGSNVPENFLKTFTGHDAAGNKVDLDDLWGGTRPRIPVAVMANGDTTDAQGRELGGIYDMRYTRACYIGPAGGGRTSSLLPAANYTTIDELPTYDDATNADALFQMAERAEEVWDSSQHPEVLDWPGLHNGPIQTLNDELHMDANSRYGRQMLASIMAYYYGKAVGLHDYQDPKLDGRYDDPAGQWVDFWVTGRNLSTERERLASLGQLGSIPAQIPDIAPHRTQVMGWAIGPVAAERAELMTANGHPVLPDNQVYCRVYPNNGGSFTWQDIISYGRSGRDGILVQEDYADQAHLNRLTVDVGQPHGILPAMPVQDQRSRPLPTTLGGRDLFTVAGNTHMRTPGTKRPTGEHAYMEARFRMDELSGAQEMMGLGNSFFVKIGASGTVILKDETTEASAPSDTVPLGEFRTIGCVINRTPGSERLAVLDMDDGGTILAETTTGLTTGGFGSSRVNFFFRGGGSVPINATFEYARIWENQLDGSGQPTHAVEATGSAPHYATPYNSFEFTNSNPDAPVNGTF